MQPSVRYEANCAAVSMDRLWPNSVLMPTVAVRPLAAVRTTPTRTRPCGKSSGRGNTECAGRFVHAVAPHLARFCYHAEEVVAVNRYVDDPRTRKLSGRESRIRPRPQSLEAVVAICAAGRSKRRDRRVILECVEQRAAVAVDQNVDSGVRTDSDIDWTKAMYPAATKVRQEDVPRQGDKHGRWVTAGYERTEAAIALYDIVGDGTTDNSLHRYAVAAVVVDCIATHGGDRGATGAGRGTETVLPIVG